MGCNDNFISNPCSQRRDELIQILDAVKDSKINTDNFSTVAAISDKNNPSRLLNKGQKTMKINSLIKSDKKQFFS